MFVQRVEALRLTTPEEDLAHRLKPGDRVVLVKMDNDPRPVPPGTQGTVERVNWIHRDRGEAQVMVSWDTGSRLMVLVPEDRIELVGSFLRRVEARQQLKPGDRVVMVKAPRPVQPGTKGTVKRADHGLILVDWGGGHEAPLAPDDRVELVAELVEAGWKQTLYPLLVGGLMSASPGKIGQTIRDIVNRSGLVRLDVDHIDPKGEQFRFVVQLPTEPGDIGTMTVGPNVHKVDSLEYRHTLEELATLIGISILEMKRRRAKPGDRAQVKAGHLDQTERQLASLQGQLRQVSRQIDSINLKQGVGSGKADEVMIDKIDTLITALRRRLNRGNRS